jgi:hypothetical protein
MERKLYQNLLNWKESKGKECLVVKGACVKIGLNQEKPYK